MNRLVQPALMLCVIGIIIGCNEQAAAKPTPAKLVTTTDSISYLIGKDIGRSLENIKDEITLDVIIKGLTSQLSGTALSFDSAQERSIMTAFNTKLQKKQEEKSKLEGEMNLAEAKKFLDENKNKSGVITTESGLQYTILKQGDGPIPTDSSNVEVHYEGTLLDGKVFDSSIKRGTPATFGVTQVIKGWTEVLKLMKVGSKYKIFVPPVLGYGSRGAGNDIKPNTMLIFEIELLGIK